MHLFGGKMALGQDNRGNWILCLSASSKLAWAGSYADNCRVSKSSRGGSQKVC